MLRILYEMLNFRFEDLRPLLAAFCSSVYLLIYVPVSQIFRNHDYIGIVLRSTADFLF